MTQISYTFETRTLPLPLSNRRDHSSRRSYKEEGERLQRGHCAR